MTVPSPLPRERWRTITDGGFRRGPAVYAIFVDGALDYIGTTSDLFERLRSHSYRIRRTWPGATITAKASYGDWTLSRLWREIRLIERLRPRTSRVNPSDRCRLGGTKTTPGTELRRPAWPPTYNRYPKPIPYIPDRDAFALNVRAGPL